MSKVRVKTDIEGAKNRDYRFHDMSTLSFFRPQVIRAIEFQPGVSMQMTNRDLLYLKPMVVPIKGNMKLKHFYYFVPFRQVMRSWNSYINGELHYYENSAAIPTQVRLLNIGHLVQMFTYQPQNNDLIYEATTGEQSDSTWKADFTILDNTHSIGITQWWKYRFTKKGRWLNSLLHTLGYELPFGIDVAKINTWKSALPLLCLAKLYLDHMKNTAYNNYVKYNSVEVILNRNADNNQNLDIQDIGEILDMLYNVNYDNDLFVSAFDNPVGPNGGAGYITNSYSITDNTVDQNNTYSIVSQQTNGTPIIKDSANATTPASLSKYIINALQRLSDFMHRHQIVGHDKLNAYLAQFGVALADEQLNISKYLGKSEQEIVVDQIFSTSDTAGANLGSFAGRGYAVNNSSTKLQTNEFGIFFDIALIVPKIGYYQGEKRMVSHINRLDFYNNTFDGMGNTIVPQSEVYISKGWLNGGTNNIAVNFNNYNKGFGFLPRYYEYKEFLSDLSGDFLCNSMKNELSAWHLFREFEDADFIGANNSFEVKHNFNFTEALDRERYERGFYQNKQDNFILITNHEMSVTSSAKDLYDFYDYDSIGKEFEVDLSGTNKITK